MPETHSVRDSTIRRVQYGLPLYYMWSEKRLNTFKVSKNEQFYSGNGQRPTVIFLTLYYNCLS